MFFADRCGTKRGSPDSRNLPKIDMASLRECFPSDPREHTRCLRSQSRLPIDFGRFSARPGALRRPFWRAGLPLGILWSSPGGSWDAPGAPGDAPDRPSKLLGRPGVPPERPGIVLALILGPAEAPKDRFWVDLSIKQHRYDIELLGLTWHQATSMWFAQSARRFEWLGRFGGNLSIWLSTTAPTLSLSTCLPPRATTFCYLESHMPRI